MQLVDRAGAAGVTVVGSTGEVEAELLTPAACLLRDPDKRVTLPLLEDPIESGLEPETGGTFTFYNYPDYFYKKPLNEFGAKYGVEVQYTAFDNINSGLRGSPRAPSRRTSWRSRPDTLDIGVAGKLVKPLNLDYIPNLQKNVWPQLVDPFYDVGSHYTVPYTCYATGIAWRADKVSEDIAMPQPWDIFWQAEAYTGKTGLLNENRETIGMALLRNGHLDINTGGPGPHRSGGRRPEELYDICNVKVSQSPYQSIPEGSRWLNQAWSGDMIAGYIYYLPKGTPRQRWRSGRTSRARSRPERLLRGLFDDEEAGALAPLPQLPPRQRRGLRELRRLQRLPAAAERDRPGLVKDGVVPENLANSVLTNEDLGPDSLQYSTLTARASSSGKTDTRTSRPTVAKASRVPSLALAQLRVPGSCG